MWEEVLEVEEEEGLVIGGGGLLGGLLVGLGAGLEDAQAALEELVF